MPTTTCRSEASAALRERLERRIQGSRLNLPVMPVVAVKVKRTAADPSSNAGTLARIIELDPSLAARLIKMTNSALYAGLSEIRDLDHAIGRLGTAMVVAVVLGAAGKEMFKSDDAMLVALLDDAWRRSIHASAVARHLAPQAGQAPEEGFLAGLLHAAGEPVLIDAVAKLVREGALPRPGADEIRDAVRPLAPSAGATLLEAWGIPASIVESVRHQRDPAAAPEPLRTSVTVVAIAAAVGELAAADDRSPESVASVVESFAGAPIAVDETAVRDWLDVAAGDGHALADVF